MKQGLVLAGAFAALAGWPGDAPAQGRTAGPKVNAQEYEGWRQYSTHCARCHGQDVLGNPVAADLLKSVAPGGPAADKDTFAGVIEAGRPSKGMPAMAGSLTDAQIDAIFAYVKGRAEGTISPGRPSKAVG